MAFGLGRILIPVAFYPLRSHRERQRVSERVRNATGIFLSSAMMTTDEDDEDDDDNNGCGSCTRSRSLAVIT